MNDLEKVRNDSELIDIYLSSSSEKTLAFMKHAAEYELDAEVTEKLSKYADTAAVFAFSAEWCPDCHRNIPVLGLVSKATGLEVRVYGHLMRDPKKPKGYWKIPPSPAEVEEFNVRKIPTIVVLDKKGNIVKVIIENPPKGKTLEEAVLDIIETL